MSMKTFAVLLSFIIFSFSIKAQDYFIRAKITEYNNKPLFLASVSGESILNVDTIFTKEDGSFSFPIKKSYQQGLYKLLFIDNYTKKITERAINLLVNGKENIEFITNYSQLYEELKITESTENKAYYDFLVKYNNDAQSYISFRNKLAYYDATDTFFKNMATSFITAYNKIDLYITQMIKKYPASVFSTIASTYRLAYVDPYVDNDTKQKMLTNNFFKGIDFNNPVLLRSDRLNNKIYEYYQLCYNPELPKPKQDTVFFKAIDNLLLTAYINENVYDFVLSYTVSMFEKFGRENILSHIANYVEDNRCYTHQESAIEQKLSRFKEVEVGKHAPNIGIRDISSGKEILLYDIQAKYTLIVFWASFCTHCTESMPKLIELYNAYTRDYFQVVAISVDTEKEIYEDMLETKGYNKWYNHCDFYGWKTPYAQQFSVQYTPNTFLLDAGKKIIDKPDFTKLAEFLSANKK